MRYARIIDGKVSEFREFAREPDPNPKKGFDWRPCPLGIKPEVDPETEVLESPTYQVGASEVTETFTKRDKTAQELDNAKEAELTAVQRLLFEVNFDQENRIRTLEGKNTITKVQYRDALKARL